MKMRMLCLIGLMLVVAFGAVAKDALEKPVEPYTPNGRAAEVEPNDDYLSANTLTVGDDMSAAIDVAGDIDFFAIAVAAGDIVEFETLAGDAGDTRMWLRDTDGTTQLVFNDDGGAGFYSLINYTFTVAGTYFIEIQHYSASGTGTYILTATLDDPPPPPPANDVCTGAIDLTTMPATFDVDLLDGGYTNQSALGSGSCTGYSANGNEAFYMVYLEVDEFITVSEDGACDLAIYMFTDCADPFTSCVIGDDSGNPETIGYQPTVAGWYYIAIDAYSSSCPVTVTWDLAVPVQNTSWTELKGIFE